MVQKHHQLLDLDLPRCSKVQMYHQILAGLTQVIVAGKCKCGALWPAETYPDVCVSGLQIFRIHALYHGQRSIVLCLTAFCTVGCAISGVSRVGPSAHLKLTHGPWQWSLARTWQQPTVNYTYSRKGFPGVGCDFSLSETQYVRLYQTSSRGTRSLFLSTSRGLCKCMSLWTSP